MVFFKILVYICNGDIKIYTLAFTYGEIDSFS